MPFVKDPKTPDCAVVGEVLPSVLSSCCAAFGDKRNPRPLVRREKVFFPVGDSWLDEGCGIFRFLAQEDKPEVENMDAGASRPATSFAGAAVGTEIEAGSAPATWLEESGAVEAARGTGSAVVSGGAAAESWLSVVVGCRSDGLTCCSSMVLKLNVSYSPKTCGICEIKIH